MSSFGEYILRRRKEFGLSQDELAAKVGVTKGTISRWEQGIATPYKKQMDKIEAALNTKGDGVWNKLRLSLYALFDEEEDSTQDLQQTINTLSEPSPNYLAERRNLKAANTPVMVPLVPVTAQAGYTKRYANTDFISSLEYYPIVPGIDPHGAIWRYFQIEGESMKDFLNSGDYVLSSQIQRDDWPDLKDALVYVIVTDELVTIKRVIKRPEKDDLVLIPDNDNFEQVAVKMDDVKEIWKYRRHIGWNASTPKKLEIKI